MNLLEIEFKYIKIYTDKKSPNTLQVIHFPICSQYELHTRPSRFVIYCSRFFK